MDTNNQTYELLMMGLGEKAGQHVYVSRLTPQSIETMRLLRSFVGVIFSIENKQEEEYNFMQLSCVGIGIQNLSRKAM